MNLLEILQPLLDSVRLNMIPVLIFAGLVFACLLLVRRHRIDRAAKAFLRAGLQVSEAKVQELRDEFAQITINEERKRISEDSKQQTEITAMQREKERILNAVRNTPAVVRETGRALQAIEREYQQALRLAKSEQAREALRLVAEKKINDVLHSVNGNGARLPQFSLEDRPPTEREQPRPADLATQPRLEQDGVE